LDFVAYYDAYWQAKDESVDHQRLDLLAAHVRAGERVLQVDCGPGWLAEKMSACGASVIATDLSAVAVTRAQQRGVDARQFLLDEGPLPFADGSFDMVVSDSQLEHRFRVDHALDEFIRVLRPGGRLLLLLPNIAHWRVRLRLLCGRFPYEEHTPTDALHIRFFTLGDIRRQLEARGLRVAGVDGSASLWVSSLYPRWLQSGHVAALYTRLARRWPSLFARDFIVLAVKVGDQPQEATS
jgi:methionine biosynthesis protein MetW